MKRLLIASLIATGLSLVVVACNRQEGSPIAPALTGSSSAASVSNANGTASVPTAEPLQAVTGSGSGIVKVTPTALADGFTAQITVNVHGAVPNTTFYIQRAPEVGRANGADGVCQRAAGLPPWGPPAPNFVTFPLPGTGPLATLQTSEGGAGSTHIDFVAPTIADGTQFDVMFRLVDDLMNPTNELRTRCFTVTVR
jgi:hypothetical protein